MCSLCFWTDEKPEARGVLLGYWNPFMIIMLWVIYYPTSALAIWINYCSSSKLVGQTTDFASTATILLRRWKCIFILFLLHCRLRFSTLVTYLWVTSLSWAFLEVFEAGSWAGKLFKSPVWSDLFTTHIDGLAFEFRLQRKSSVHHETKEEQNKV